MISEAVDSGLVSVDKVTVSESRSTVTASAQVRQFLHLIKLMLYADSVTVFTS